MVVPHEYERFHSRSFYNIFSRTMVDQRRERRRKKKEQTKEKAFILYLNACGFITSFFFFYRGFNNKCYMLFISVCENMHYLQNNCISTYVGKIMNEQKKKKKTESRKKEKSANLFRMIRLCVCTLISYQFRNKQQQLLFNQIKENNFLSLSLVKF